MLTGLQPTTTLSIIKMIGSQSLYWRFRAIVKEIIKSQTLYSKCSWKWHWSGVIEGKLSHENMTF